MRSDIDDFENQPFSDEQELAEPSSPYILSKFKLYETRSNFYLVGRDKGKRKWRVLKIDRSEYSELNLNEDPTVYSFRQICVLLRCIHEGNKPTGGLKFVATCYGIVGFIKFLGPYYMLLITERRKVGMICGQAIYAVSKSRMIPIPHSTLQSNMDISKNENRYKKLLGAVDITKDFFFSYSYRLMHSLQKNYVENETGLSYDTMFCWNSFLTREIRSNLGNTLWTVALIHGFFRQVKLNKCGRSFSITLIARRSRHYAGTRYLKRGVNKKGRAANDVETEQIVFQEGYGGFPSGISSVVQNRASIPLFWSQETSRLNIKPDIILSDEDENYEATKLHFQNLVSRYGNPIIILNLIKKHEKKPRESVLHAEYVKAVAFINRSLAKENRLKFLTLDLHKIFRLKGGKVLMLLNKVASYAFEQTGFFYCRINPSIQPGESFSFSFLETDCDGNDIQEDYPMKSPSYQRGVLRTNCIDCLDRTNVAQYAYGLVALGQQLHALRIIDSPEIDIDDQLAYKLMGIYEAMGDTLALQYGGSAAHNKIFSERRGQWKAAAQSQEFIRTLQRYLSNAYMDTVKQDAINLFLGHFQPDVDSPALWELGADHHYNIGSLNPSFSEEISRSMLRRSLSDGNILCESTSGMIQSDVKGKSHSVHPLPNVTEEDNRGLSDSQPNISTRDDDMSTPCEINSSYSRFKPTMAARELFPSMQEGQCLGDEISYLCQEEDDNDSDIIDYDWISSSGNSCEEEAYDRSSLVSSPAASAYGHAMNELAAEGKEGNPDAFSRWVEYGALFIP